MSGNGVALPPPQATMEAEKGREKTKPTTFDHVPIQGNHEIPDVPSSLDTKRTSPSRTQNTAPEGTAAFRNGYHFPPKRSWTETTRRGVRRSMKFCITPVGFLATIYGLNVVAWGAMLFLLLCNAAPAMCQPTCDDNNAPRQIWIEIDSQILNGLFSVANLGTIPWRLRGWWYLMQYRLQKNDLALRRLAGINRGWFRLPGSQDLPARLGPTDEGIAVALQTALPYPPSKTPCAPLTGVRSPPTSLWKLDFVIWALVWNSLLQVGLCVLMWGFDRHTRPSWATGMFVVLTCIFGTAAGVVAVVEKRKVKAIEGVELCLQDRLKLARDQEAGIIHWNNIKDKQPKKLKTVREAV